MSREINDQNYLEELFINEATPALENAGGGAVDLEPIATAITNKGVATAADAEVDVMAENISKIVTGKLIYLGTGTSFNVQSVCSQNGVDYTKLTKSNFIVGASGMGSVQTDHPLTSSFASYYVSALAGGFSISYSYNSGNGVLSVGGNGQTIHARDWGNSKTVTSVGQYATCFAYLFYAG